MGTVEDFSLYKMDVVKDHPTINDPNPKGVIDNVDLNLDYQKFQKEKNPFPIEIFPKVYQEIILEAESKYQFSPDYIGAGILSAASISIGVTHKAHVKHLWNEKVNFYLLIAGRPGDSKSHALKFCFKPIEQRDNKLYKEFLYQQNLYEDQLKEDSNNSQQLKKPKIQKFLITDFTPEALINTHYYNPRGLCIYVDELNGWIRNFNRYNSGSEAETYLSLWSGTSVTLDRASGKSLRINDPFISVIGSTQISVLKEFGKNGRNNNGFMDRLLFVYPTQQKPLKWNIDKVDTRIIKNYHNLITKLLDLQFTPEEPTLVPFNREAKKILFEWQNERNPDDCFYDFERGIDIKLQQYVIRFALTIQMLYYTTEESGKNEIGVKAVKSAIKLFDYFYKNAIRVRQETVSTNYLESLTELQLTIYNELPKKFTTSQGVEIACKMVNNKKRISERQFKTYLNEKRLFKKLSRGLYEKTL
jgi:Protein of unknown function (DUF3987)